MRVRPYLWALGAVWLTWFAILVGSSVYADASTNGNALVAPYLVWVVGIALAAVLSALTCAVIACVQCSDAHDRRMAGRVHR